MPLYLGEKLISGGGTPGPRGESGVYVGTEKPTDPDIHVWINPNGQASDIPGGAEEVYVGTEEPTDPSVKVWINPEGEPIDIPTGSGEAEWQKKTVSLTEAVSAIEINDLSTKKVIVYAYLFGNDADNSLTTGSTKLRVSVNGYLAHYGEMYLRASSGYYHYFDIEKLVQKTKVYNTKVWGNHPSWGQTNDLVVGGWLDTDKDTSETINSIKIAVEGTTHFISSGSWVEVYYK